MKTAKPKPKAKRRTATKRASARPSRSTKAKAPGPFELVWQLVQRVPRGRVTTYGQLSELIGRRLTPVGVGWALRAAPEGTIPWQRVVSASGALSTEREHPGLQRAMLEGEGVRFDEEGRIDLARHLWRPRSLPDVAWPRRRSVG